MNLSTENIMPFFQPIIAIDTNEVYSYEVLGRYIDRDGTVKSMGPFFSDKNVPSEKALELDRIIRKKAMQRYAEEGRNEYLFINLRLKWIADFVDKPEKMPTILFAEEYGIDFSRLVIEITEEEFNDENEDFIKAIAFYKSIGCRIAIDDYGKGASHIDRLSALAPDIIKIDMSYVHRSEESYYYREYLKTISSFADHVGIEVLYEGIENLNQLDICVSSKGRYYQGFLLAKPQPCLKNAVINQSAFLKCFNGSITALHDKSERINERRNFWDAQINNFFEARPFDPDNADINAYFSLFCSELSECVKRVYICDRYGCQLSYNIEKRGETIEIIDYRNKNWSWRGYFQKAMIAFNSGMKSYLTSEYRDVVTKEKMYTYVRFIHSNMLLHIDVLKVIE